jgi:LAO/AO transport system kinase
MVHETDRPEVALNPDPDRGARSAPGARRVLGTQEYVQGVLAGDRAAVARAITLVESSAPAHQDQAQEVLAALLPQTGRALRLGITGVPGAGKSTFIEALGTLLSARGRRTAVLAIDPSSAVSGGSILGDKTRMERLARDPRCFIRPSPSAGALGGVHRRTREAILVLEAAGFDPVIVETVGVGQNETAVRAMVDCLLVMMITGGGDDLQGVKRGVTETADLLVVNKADGENRARAEALRADCERLLPLLRPATPGWTPPVRLCSASTGDGVEAIWGEVERFQAGARASGALEDRRRAQRLEWMDAAAKEQVLRAFFGRPEVAARLQALRAGVLAGTIPVTRAVQELVGAVTQGDESGAGPPPGEREGEEPR